MRRMEPVTSQRVEFVRRTWFSGFWAGVCLGTFMGSYAVAAMWQIFG